MVHSGYQLSPTLTKIESWTTNRAFFRGYNAPALFSKSAKEVFKV
jgi:hypothetical protein